MAGTIHEARRGNLPLTDTGGKKKRKKIEKGKTVANSTKKGDLHVQKRGVL